MEITIPPTATSIYVVSESWLNAVTTNSQRGQVLSAYIIVSFGGTAAGPLLINVGDPATAQLLPPDGEVDREGLDAQIQLAQRIAHEQPQDAVMALRRMLAEPMPEGAAR